MAVVKRCGGRAFELSRFPVNGLLHVVLSLVLILRRLFPICES
jgi:hypothetical protein